jgi:hypothetical protein
VTEFLRVDPDAPTYREFVRLYEVAKGLRSCRVDRWNRELYARTDNLWGGLDPKTGSMRLSAYKVLPYLTGPPGHHDREATARAMQTALHEIDHCFIPVDVTDQPGESRPANIVRTIESKALDEGLTEYLAARDLRPFARRSGYGTAGDAPRIADISPAIRPEQQHSVTTAYCPEQSVSASPPLAGSCNGCG